MMKKVDKENVKINSIIGEGTLIEGDYTAKGAVRMDGCIQGNVQVSGVLILGASGKICGNVSVSSAVIGGELIGNLEAENKVELTGSAKVIGDIKTNGIVIDENAIFQGRCDMNQEIPEGTAGFGKTSSKAIREGRKSAREAIREALKEAEAEENMEQGNIEEPVSEEISFGQYIND